MGDTLNIRRQYIVLDTKLSIEKNTGIVYAKKLNESPLITKSHITTIKFYQSVRLSTP